jgi:hypothetical protein
MISDDNATLYSNIVNKHYFREESRKRRAAAAVDPADTMSRS